MRSFIEVLQESKKVYPFKVGVAGPLPEGFADHLESALQKYSVVKMTKGKKTPIQERPMDFPNLQNTEVTYFDVELNYPTTSQVLAEYVSQCCTLNRANVVVRGANEPVEQQLNVKENDVYEPILTKEDLGGESAQDKVGNNRVMDLLKELEKARKERADSTQEN
jgi:hypothetical protein